MNFTRIFTIIFAFTVLQACAGEEKKTEVLEGEKGQKIQKVNTFKNLEASELKTVLETETDDITILDVRTPGEIAGGKIDVEAEEMDFYDQNFGENLESLDKTKPVYVYCKAGGRSSSAAKMLIEKGFNEVYNLNGGIDAWKRSGYEVK